MTNKTLLAALAFLPVVAMADNAANNYFSGQKDPDITRQEAEALKIGDKFRGETGIQPGAKPVTGKDGTITFAFGAQQPSIICAPLQLCDIAMQPGETINDVKLGDTVRWVAEPAITGSGMNEIQHIIIAPKDVGLSTSMIVLTDRRTYHLQLKSHSTKYMAQVNFAYPDESSARFRVLAQRAAVQREAKREAMTTSSGEYLGDLNFGYSIEGKASWKPTRVYTDGKKTIIEMPDDISTKDAPALLVIWKKGFFNGSTTTLVNYRMQGKRYIVDSVPASIILVSGVGSSQERVTITRNGS